jgi:hypothetical protein
MAARLLALRTCRALLPRNIISFTVIFTSKLLLLFPELEECADQYLRPVLIAAVFAPGTDPALVAVGARVLLRAAGGQGAIRELCGGAVPGPATTAPASAARQRSPLLPQPVRRRAQGTATVLRAAEARGLGSRLRPAASRSHDMRCGKYRHLTPMETPSYFAETLVPVFQT